MRVSHRALPTPHKLVKTRVEALNRFSYCNYAKYTKEALSALVKEAPVVVFMKGVPEAPACGFSRAVIQVLNAQGVVFEPTNVKAHNILENDDLRVEMKAYAYVSSTGFH